MTNLYVVLATVACLATAQGTSSSLMKNIPTIANSLVNLGKMEISLYFNGKQPEFQAATKSAAPSSPIARSRPMEPLPCPCSAFRSSKDEFLPDPSELINKILRSNDLFKDPTSTHCCDSHEQIQESTVFFEASPNRAPITINNRSPMKLPFPFPPPVPSFPKFLNNQGFQPKAMEIFLFPKRKDIMNMDVMKSVTKPAKEFPEIQVVGDKDIKPLNEGASVKKDLTSLLEKKEIVEERDESLKVEVTSTPLSNTFRRKAARSIVSTEGRLAAPGSSISSSSGSSHNFRPSHRCFDAVLVVTPKETHASTRSPLRPSLLIAKHWLHTEFTL